jgi:hypothetical protein
MGHECRCCEIKMHAQMLQQWSPKWDASKNQQP